MHAIRLRVRDEERVNIHSYKSKCIRDAKRLSDSLDSLSTDCNKVLAHGNVNYIAKDHDVEWDVTEAHAVQESSCPITHSGHV